MRTRARTWGAGLLAAALTAGGCALAGAAPAAAGTSWIIRTMAGSGTSGYAGDGGPATSARLSSPTAVDITPSGSIAFIDSGNLRIRTVSSS